VQEMIHYRNGIPDGADIAEIQTRARFLFTASSEEMDRVYGRNSYIRI